MDSSAPDHLEARLLQRVHLAPLDVVPGELYAKTTGAVRCERSSAHLAPWSTLSTQTYFGRVPVSYLQRWTSVEAVELVVSARGRGRIELVAQDHLPGTRVVAQQHVDTDEAVTVRLSTPVAGFLESGHVWVDASTSDGELEIGDLRVEASSPGTRRSFSIVICTFNRPEHCSATVARIASDPTALATIDRIVVVDQGDRLVADTPGFDAVQAALGDRLQIIRQGNFGGAGGFTRGVLEVRRQAGEADGGVILMDDDVQLEPDSLVRLTAFDAHRRAPLMIGGQMLNLRHPSVLLTHGEQTDLPDLRAGLPVDSELAGVDLLETLPTRRIDVEYNAWWMCMVPFEVFERGGLPLPIFFQFDDIEIGLRGRELGIQTVTLPGAAVWHEDFDLKDWDSPTAFFWHRNALICAALHSDLVPGGVVENLSIRLRHLVIAHRYGVAATVLHAVDEFLGGPQRLSGGSVDDLAAVSRLRADYPDTHQLTVAQLREHGLDHLRMQVLRDDDQPADEFNASIRRFIGQARGSMQPEVAVPSGAQWWHASSFRTVVTIDRSQNAFRVRRYSRSESIRLMRESRRMMRRLRKEGPRVVEQWRAARAELTSEESWQRVLELDRTV